jgi:hypothetical protein
MNILIATTVRMSVLLPVMVGGDDGVVGPKELVGWVGTVTDSRSYTPPTPRSTKVGNIVFYHSVETLLRQCKTFLPQDVPSKNHPCMAT